MNEHVKDYSENMMKHRRNKDHAMWSLEATAKILFTRFPRSHIWVVKPSNMYLFTFSQFSNFVESSDIGNPTHSSDHGGWRHLSRLLPNACQMLNSAPQDVSQSTEEASSINNHQVSGSSATDTQTNDHTHHSHKLMQSVNDQSQTCDKDSCSDTNQEQNGGQELCSAKLPVILVGFSKGCIVLNQLLHELAISKEDSELKHFISRVSDMYWLDGGHNGGSDTWVTQEDVLRHLVDMNIEIHSHVTPYQMGDPNRAWIKEEQGKFLEKLKELNIKVDNTIHFGDQPGSIQNHFSVLKVF